jgi:DNA-binding beta-propeller fold protein YncE
VTLYGVSSITDGEAATNVLGQSTYTATASSNAQGGLNDPRGLAYDSTKSRLFVASYGSNRVTVFSTTSMAAGQNADNIIGQPTYASTTAASTQNGLSGPVGLAFDATNRRLFVIDSSNNRLSVYDGSGSNISYGVGAAPDTRSQFQFLMW